MAVDQLLKDLKSDTFNSAAVVKAVKANPSILESLTEELAKKTGANGKSDGLTAMNAFSCFTAVFHASRLC